MRVSRGKRERSTVVPARAPARRADWKDGGDEDAEDIVGGIGVRRMEKGKSMMERRGRA